MKTLKGDTVASFNPDGSIQTSDGRTIFADDPVTVGEFSELAKLLGPKSSGGGWPFVSGGGGGGTGGSNLIPVGNGAQGAQGSQGAQGPGVGAQGAQGPVGPQGFNGSNGAQGSQGATGTGSQGAQGSQGSGSAGAQGAQGTTGAQGATGSGSQGAQGAAGAPGSQGTTGAQGATGSGAQGATGAQGSAGAQGAQGADGVSAGRVYVFASPSGLTTTDNSLIPWLPGQGDAIDFFQCSVKTAPTGASVIVDFKLVTLATGVVGATVATVTITAGSFYGSTTIGTPITVQTTQALAMEITQVGSTIAGSDLVGTGQGPSAVMPIYAFSETSTLTTTDNSLIPWVPGQGTPISLFSAVVKTAPTGASIIIDFKRVTMSTGVVGATVATVTIPAGSFYATTTLGSPVTILTTEALAMEIAQVGSTIAGANLTGVGQ
jgi:hypothetical protein